MNSVGKFIPTLRAFIFLFQTLFSNFYISVQFAAMKHKEDPCMTEFDLSLGGDFEKVPARVLPSPKLEYDNNKTVNVSKGVWRNDKVGFFCPSTEIGMNNSWTILSLDNRANDRSLHDLKSKLQKTGKILYNICL